MTDPQAPLNVTQADTDAAVNAARDIYMANSDVLCGADVEAMEDALTEAFAAHRLSATADLTRQLAVAREALRLFPEAHDVLTAQEMRDAKGNWRSLIDQQNNALVAIRSLTSKEEHHG